jgi:hypothetical protein
VSTIDCNWQSPLPPCSGLWREGEGKVAHLVHPNKLEGCRKEVKAMQLMSSGDVTGRLCVARVVACGLLAGVRCAEDIVEWSVLNVTYTNYLHGVPSRKEKLDTYARLKALYNPVDFSIKMCVIIVSPSQAPPAESDHRPRTRWRARRGSVGRCYR